MMGPGGMMDRGMMGPGGMMGRGMMGPGGMMGHGMMGRGMMAQEGMMGRGTMGPPVMMRIIFSLMDSDGDGTISLQEFQAAHERIFKGMDANKDGRTHSGGDAGLHAGNEESGSGAVGPARIPLIRSPASRLC